MKKKDFEKLKIREKIIASRDNYVKNVKRNNISKYYFKFGKIIYY